MRGGDFISLTPKCNMFSETGIFKEPLDRQIMEKVQISNFKGDILMNRKNELGGALLEREQFKYRRWGAGGL